MADVIDGPPEAGPHANPASMIAAAEKAAADGDYPSAERLLRDAAARQEADLGAQHPDLATTLNNLAFVCEQLEKFGEAEAGYRRAHAIAVASLSPGHPFIKTSLSNLVEFCAARGIPLWAPPAAQEEESAPDDESGESSEIEVAATRRVPRAAIAAAALVVVAIVIVIMRQGQGTTAAPDPTLQTAPVPVPQTAPEPAPQARSKPEPPAATAPAAVTVLTARLCSALERTGSPDWQCTPASGDLQPGRYLFYTRLQTTTATTLEHRWYHDGRVHQVMRLSVPAAPGNGYRTFSGNTISPDRTGDWKVELRAADGRLLHEERFVIR